MFRRSNTYMSRYTSRRDNSRNQGIEDLLDRPLPRLRELFRIIREVAYLRVLVRLVIKIRIYFYLYSSMSF